MKHQFRTRFLVSLLAIVVCTVACNKDDEIATDFNTAVDNLSLFDQPDELDQPEELDSTDPQQDPDDATLECFTKTYRAAPGYDELLALDPTTDVIYPGALIQGSSIPTGEYIPITTSRDPITLSISLQNLSGSPVVEIKDPKLSTVREGIKSIMDQEVVSSTPAKISFELSEVYSEEHVNLALGANYRTAGNSVSSSFDFSQSTYRYKYILKYLQVYYTIDMDAPQDPADLFKNIPDMSLFAGTAPCYVASMAYGRMVLYTIESNSTSSEINAAFNASFSSGGGSIAGSHQKVINESSIKALVIGGSGASCSSGDQRTV